MKICFVLLVLLHVDKLTERATVMPRGGGKIRSYEKNYSVTFLWYDTDRIENNASNYYLLPRESVYQAVD
jgi:hypothetical protein